MFEARPVGSIQRSLRLLHPGTALLVVIAVPVMIALAIQFLTSAIISVAVTQTVNVLPLFSYLAFYVSADPALRYGVNEAGVLHWGLVGLFWAVLIGSIFAARKRLSKMREDPQNRPGQATWKAIKTELGETNLVHKLGAKLRPSLAGSQIKPADVGYLLGTFKEKTLWLRVEDPTLAIGPSRAGKGLFFVLNMILSAPGALITTSSKLDNAQITMRARERKNSRVWIFAPGTAGGEDLGHVLRWDPIRGCEDERTLVRRIKALIPGDSFSGSTTNAGHWDTLGQQLASHLFHAAACGGYTVDKIWEWVTDPKRAEDAVDAIRRHPNGLEEHARHLQTVINGTPEVRANQWGVLTTSLAFMESRSVREWMKPTAETDFDPVAFVLDKATLYLVGDQASKGSYERLIDGLLAELDYVSKGLADASPGARLDPPITYLLDEAGNFEYSGLYELITAGGGRGRVGIAIFQSKAQLNQWGQDNADTMWDAAVAKIILPGGANPKVLQELSELIGEFVTERESHSLGEGAGSVQVSDERRAIIHGYEIRQLEKGYGLLLYRHLPAIFPKLIPFTDHEEYEQCVKDAEELAAIARKASPFLKYLEERSLNA